MEYNLTCCGAFREGATFLTQQVNYFGMFFRPAPLTMETPLAVQKQSERKGFTCATQHETEHGGLSRSVSFIHSTSFTYDQLCTLQSVRGR